MRIKAVLENKTKPDGQKKRLEILRKYYSDSDLVINKFLKDVPARKKMDDVIDALCLAIFLELKLQEEVNEFLEDKNLEELADVMEVLFGLAEALGYSEEALLKVRDKKLEERGGFKDGVALKATY